MTIGRRTVLQGLALPFAWTFGMGSARAFWRREFDVLVVGAGGAGLAAAVAAAEEGASVLVLEKEEAIGGNTLRASGLFNAADPERQGPMGVEDSVAWHAEQTIESGGGRNDPDVVRRFAEEALPTIHWLEGMGIRFLPETQTTWGAEWPRGHKPFLPRGSSYIRTLSGKLLESGGEIRTKTALRDLLRDERGRITGVVTTEGVEIRAKCVVLASGGYGANPNLLKRWAPAWAELPTDNAPGSTGDGQLAAERAGAALVNLEVVQAVPGVRRGQTHAVRLDLDVGACILVDGRGERLVEEDGSRRALALAIRNAVGGRAYTVTDDRGVSSYDLVSQKDIYRGLQTGDAFRAETLEALGRKAGIPAEALRRTVEAFNGEAEKRSGKCGRVVCRKIETPPFWAAPVYLNLHSTLGGVRITSEGAVLDREGNVLPGLYAAGEIVGNVHGANRIGGNGIAAAITFGRIAGRSAARAALGR